jgi:hypothetical protein
MEYLVVDQGNMPVVMVLHLRPLARSWLNGIGEVYGC